MWFRVDDKAHHHVKLMTAGNEACGAWVRLGSWCGDHLTDGHVPEVVALDIAKRQEVLDALMDAGLLKMGLNAYQMHDFCDWNPTAKQVKRQRKQRSEAGRKGGKQTASKRQASATANAKQKPSGCSGVATHPDQAKANPDPTRPDPTEVDQSGAVAPSSEVAPPTAAELAKAIRAADIATVWASYIAAWTKHHPGKGPKPRLTTGRRSAISARLTDGHSVEALCSIPAKLFASAHHLGQNDRETAYLGSEYAFGKAERVERWLTKAAPRIGRGYVQHGGQEGIAMLPELNRRTAELKRSLAKETGT